MSDNVLVVTRSYWLDRAKPNEDCLQVIAEMLGCVDFDGKRCANDLLISEVTKLRRLIIWDANDTKAAVKAEKERIAVKIGALTDYAMRSWDAGDVIAVEHVLELADELRGK